MKSSDYWNKRAVEREEYSRRIADEALKRDILPAYDRAAKQLNADAQKILHTYMKNGNLSEAEARKMLNAREPKEVLDALRKEIKDIKDPVIKKQLLSRVNAPTYAARISRAEALKERVYIEMGKVSDKEIERAGNVIKNSYEHTYYRSIFDTQKGTGYAFSFAELPQKAIESVLNESWSGSNYSKLIWHNTRLLAERAQKVITSGIISGKSIAFMARQIDETMNDGKYAAVRLVRTESNRAYNAAELEAYREEGVSRYRFLSVLDNHTCAVCGKLDGKTYGIEEAKEGINYPPMHPNDRCTTVGVYDDECIEGLKRRARNPVTGKNELIPRDMTFEEWEKSLKKTVEKPDESGIMRLNRSANRREANTGAFSNLKISMQKREVLSLCQKYRIDTKGLTIKIQRSENLLAVPIYGSTAYDNIGRIDLLPNAFVDEEQLIRTILHEKCHVMQLQKYGKKYTQENLNLMEKQASRFENIYYKTLSKKVK